MLGGIGHLAALAEELAELLVQPVALGLHLSCLCLEHRDALGELAGMPDAERPPDAVGERTAKYNRLLGIAQELGADARWANPFRPV